MFLQQYPRSAIMDSAYHSITLSLIRRVSFCPIHMNCWLNTQNRVWMTWISLCAPLMTLIPRALNSVIDPLSRSSTDSPRVLCKPRLDYLSIDFVWVAALVTSSCDNHPSFLQYVVASTANDCVSSYGRTISQLTHGGINPSSFRKKSHFPHRWGYDQRKKWRKWKQCEAERRT